MQKVGILFALEDEESGFKRVLIDSRSLVTRGDGHNVWVVGNAQVLVHVSGIGRERSEAAAQHLIDQGAGWIVCAGFATALEKDIRSGDVVVASRVLLNENGVYANAYPCSDSLLAAVPPSGTLGYAIRHCDLVTNDTLVRSSEERLHIYRLTGAAALDMESYAAAAVCYKHGVPFAAIRAISDTIEHELPAEIESLAEMKTFYHQIAFVGARPHIWRDVLRLQRQAKAAANNLGDILGVMILRLT